jgi:hypothetical protein
MEYVRSLDEIEQALAIKVNVFNSTSLCLRSTLEALKDAERHNFRIRKMKKHKIKGIPGESSIIVKRRTFSDIAKEMRKLVGLD